MADGCVDRQSRYSTPTAPPKALPRTPPLLRCLEGVGRTWRWGKGLVDVYDGGVKYVGRDDKHHKHHTILAQIELHCIGADVEP